MTPHLWVVASEPDPDGQFVIVNLSSLRGNKDQTVTLRKGEHPFVRHDTCVNYAAADVISVQVLEEHVEFGSARIETNLERNVLELIQDGFAASDFTKDRIRDFMKMHRAKTRNPSPR